MNQFRTFLLNPNVHGIFALISQIASFIPALAPWSAILSTVAGTLTATTVLLPESGSLHADDYKKLADHVVSSVSAIKDVSTLGRS